MQPDTLVVHADYDVTDDKSVAPSIQYSAVFKAADAAEFIAMSEQPQHPQNYTRYGNPTHERVKKIVAALEGTETALVTGSGMGAISAAILSFVKAGDHVIGQTRHYMSTTKLLDDMLRGFGVEITLVEQADTEAFRRAIRPNTRLITLESPSNPLLTLTDIAAIARMAREHGIVTIADNTLATALNQRPHALGVDVVVQSATKYLGGHHDLTGGVICTSEEYAEKIWRTHITLGSVLSPMDAWLLLRGMRTLPMRIERVNANALALARALEAHPMIERVLYPGLESHPQHALALRQMSGFGGIVTFTVAGGYAAAERFVSMLELPLNAPSLGGVDSLCIHAAAMWAGTLSVEQMAATGIPPNLVRYAMGVEHIDDLLADVRQALARL
jgi:cystathionine beta-lyase/cystathionine gamma-synthase